MRALLAVIAMLLAGVFVYVVPGLTELALIRQHLSPWFSCVLLGDTAGCVTLYLLGRRVTAVALYVISSMLEALLLSFHLMSPVRLVWFSNAIPAIAVGVILIKAGLRNMVVEEY
jgi:hypothetical protein